MKYGHSKATWQDLYYDGIIDYGDDFCEDTQEIVRYAKREYVSNADLRQDEKREREIDEHYLRLKRGEIHRIR